MKISKIISGGQTGADRAGLDAAIYLNIPYGGTCPKGRRSEDGKIPDIYILIESPQMNYLVRTEDNIKDSDLTLLFTRGVPSGGSKKTIELCKKHSKPCLYINCTNKCDFAVLANNIINWLNQYDKELIVNIAGSRESKHPGIYKQVFNIMIEVLINV